MNLMDHGNYQALILSGATTQSATKGTPQIEITIQVRERIEEDEAITPLGSPVERTITWYLSPKAREYTLSKLGKIGFNGDFAAPDFTNEPIAVECQHEEYNGQDRERWDLARRKSKPASKDVIAAMQKEWASKGGEVRAAAPKAAQAMPEDDDDGDSIPF